MENTKLLNFNYTSYISCKYLLVSTTLLSNKHSKSKKHNHHKTITTRNRTQNNLHTNRCTKTLHSRRSPLEREGTKTKHSDTVPIAPTPWRERARYIFPVQFLNGIAGYWAIEKFCWYSWSRVSSLGDRPPIGADVSWSCVVSYILSWSDEMPCSEDDDSQTGFSEPTQGMSKAELRKVNTLLCVWFFVNFPSDFGKLFGKWKWK